MKRSLLLILVLLSLNVCQPEGTRDEPLLSLRVSENGRFLVKENGDPFFWLGDTGWRLIAKLNREDARRYLADRSEKGFTVIQVQLLPLVVEHTNAYGETAFLDRDVRKPNEPYWEHVDYVLETAAELGLYMAVLPAWARAYTETRLGNPENKILSDDPEAAYVYGSFLGGRYQEMENLIWILGGDSWGTKDSIYDNLAEGIKDTYGHGNPDRVLMSYHPKGGTYRPPATSSAEFYHDKEWLDFNMIQSGHRIGNRNFERITEDYRINPVKPTLESEPCYEHHPVRHDFANGEFSAWHLRRRAYWSILAGGFGFTYGGNGIWQMATPEEPGRDSHFNYYWYEALDHEGGKQMIHVRNLFESRPFIDPERMPDQGILLDPTDSTDAHIQSARAEDFSYWIIYVTNGREFSLKADLLQEKKYRAWWYDPRTGKVFGRDAEEIRKPFKITIEDQVLSMDPPGEEGEGQDWILVLDEVSARYGVPGKVN